MKLLWLSTILPLSALAWSPWGVVELDYLFNSNVPSHVDATGPYAKYRVRLEVNLPIIWDAYLKIGARGISSNQSFNQGGGILALGYKVTERLTVGIFHESMHNFDYIPTDRPYNFTSENHIFIKYRFGGD